MKKRQFNMINKFKSISSAIIVFIMILVIAAMAGFAAISLNYTSSTAIDNAMAYSDNITAQVNFDIDSYISNMKNISDIVSKSSDVQGLLFNASENGATKAKEYTRLVTQFQAVLDSRADISNIAAVSDRNVGVVNSGQDDLISYKQLSRQEWFQNTMNNPDGITISNSHVQNAISGSYQWVITLSRPLIDKSTNEIHGIFFIDLNYSVISNLCNNNQIGNKGYVYIIDSSGNLIYHPQQQLIYGGLKSEHTDDVLNSGSSSMMIGTGNDMRLYTKSSSSQTGWTTVGVSYTSELTKYDEQTLLLYIGLAIGILLLAFFAADYISRGITMPIFNLLKSMKQAEKGEFKKAMVPVAGSNEVSQLSEGFNSMTARIDELVAENKKELEEKRKSELRALQSQINPHFLYNTLDSIIWMAEAGKNEEVVQMTAALSRLFRQGINVEDEEIMLSQEIDYCRSYLLIQKYRFQDKLDYEVKMESDVGNVMIVKMVLQPIIENAINHGLKEKGSKGNLTVHAFRDGDCAKIIIRDDGVGMDEDTLLHIFEHHKVNRSKNGVGIYNVQRRLHLYYGEEYGIAYESSPGEGTTACVTIPMEKADDGSGLPPDSEEKGNFPVQNKSGLPDNSPVQGGTP